MDRLHEQPQRSPLSDEHFAPVGTGCAERRGGDAHPSYGAWRRATERQTLQALVEELREVRNLLEAMRNELLECGT